MLIPATHPVLDLPPPPPKKNYRYRSPRANYIQTKTCTTNGGSRAELTTRVRGPSLINPSQSSRLEPTLDLFCAKLMSCATEYLRLSKHRHENQIQNIKWYKFSMIKFRNTPSIKENDKNWNKV